MFPSQMSMDFSQGSYMCFFLQSKYNTFPELLAFSFLFVNGYNTKAMHKHTLAMVISTYDSGGHELNKTKCNYRTHKWYTAANQSQNLAIFKNGNINIPYTRTHFTNAFPNFEFGESFLSSKKLVSFILSNNNYETHPASFSLLLAKKLRAKANVQI